MRINKYLASNGLGSRRKCDDLILNGLIKVNGKILKDFSYQVKNDDVVQCKNKYIDKIDKCYSILHKPKGYI